MNDTSVNRDWEDTNAAHVPASEVADAHESDGTLGRVAGTGTGAIAGGIVGAAVAGPVGAVVGAVAGGALGAAAGDAAHTIGDDHDDVNVETGSGGELGRYSGSGAGGLSGAIVGGAAAGPVGAVGGAIAGGMLGAEAGDAAKDMGDRRDDDVSDDLAYDATTPGYVGTTDYSGTAIGAAGVPGATTGIGGLAVPISTLPPDNDDTNYGTGGRLDNPDYNPGLPSETRNEDTRGTMERLADTATGDVIDDNTGRVVTDNSGRPLTGDYADDAIRDERSGDSPRLI